MLTHGQAGYLGLNTLMFMGLITVNPYVKDCAGRPARGWAKIKREDFSIDLDGIEKAYKSCDIFRQRNVGRKIMNAIRSALGIPDELVKKHTPLPIVATTFKANTAKIAALKAEIEKLRHELSVEDGSFASLKIMQGMQEQFKRLDVPAILCNPDDFFLVNGGERSFFSQLGKHMAERYPKLKESIRDVIGEYPCRVKKQMMCGHDSIQRQRIVAAMKSMKSKSITPP